MLTVTQMLRKKGVVGKFVEFFGPGLANLTLEDRATIGNMAPEYGATCGFFPVDDDTIAYLQRHRPRRRARRAGRGLRQGAGPVPHQDTPDPVFTDMLELDLAHGRALARRARSGRRTASLLKRAPSSGFASRAATSEFGKARRRSAKRVAGRRARNYDLGHGDVVIAAITSCTNTSNPSVLIAAGLLARKAVARRA